MGGGGLWGGLILGLNRDNGTENGNCGDYRVYIGVYIMIQNHMLFYHEGFSELKVRRARVGRIHKHSEVQGLVNPKHLRHSSLNLQWPCLKDSFKFIQGPRKESG